jgi:hypothetical protein
MGKFLVFAVLLCLPFATYAQLDCVGSPVPTTHSKGYGEWKAYVFQLSENYNPNEDWFREFNSGGAARQFKGYLKFGPNFLTPGTVNFDINFGDTDNYASDVLFFGTTKDFKGTTPGCNTQLQDFGVIFRSVVTIPAGQSGIYRYTVGSDDGTRLNLTMKEGDLVVNDTTFENWKGPKTFEYPENIFNYYVAHEAGQTINLDLSYFEKKGSNRVSFNMVRYLGPGEIGGSQDLCGMAPDPAPFKSIGPAAFLAGSISYQWQYSPVNSDDSQWTDIPGANGLTYDVSQYSPGNGSETHYFRRVAINTSNDVVTKYASNVLTVNVSYINGDGQQEYGQNRWIGHLYDGIGNFSDNAYKGRIYEESIFKSNFDFNNTPSSPNSFTPDYGCTFVTERFSIRYKMKLNVSPGTYNFQVRGDDGFRLSVDGGASWIINDWKNGSALPAYTQKEVQISEVGQLDLVLEYYEDTQSNLIDFKYEFAPQVLPLEWGTVSVQACGSVNCLSWETLQEQNTSHFELERSYNGHTWEMFDNSVQAEGYSTEKITYQGMDSNFMGNQVYYRIKQLDADGAFAYSDIVRVHNSSFSVAYLPFPNPTIDKIRFFSNSEVTKLTLVSHDFSVNKEIALVRIQDNLYEVDLMAFRRGNYMLFAHKQQGEIEVFKVIKK